MRKLFEIINNNLSRLRISNLFKKKSTSRKSLPVITLSREKGSGGRLIAYLVAKKLGKPWKVYHKEIVEAIARQTHLENNLIKEIDEKSVSLIEELIADFFGRKYLNLSSYYKNLVKILSIISQRGYAVIVGRGANFLLPESLKVRVICDMKQRIDWLIEYEKITEREAIRKIELSDRERKEFIEELFHHDPKKAHHYDIIVRTSQNLSIEQAADMIAALAKKRFKI